MLALPTETPVTKPVKVSTVAMPGRSVAHLPPLTVSVSVVVSPSQTDDRPLIVPADMLDVMDTALDAFAEPHALTTV
jgi:hypothetical protein